MRRVRFRVLIRFLAGLAHPLGFDLARVSNMEDISYTDYFRQIFHSMWRIFGIFYYFRFALIFFLLFILVGETFVSDFICSNVSTTINAGVPPRMLLSSKRSGQQQPAGNVEFIAGTGIEW